MSWNKGGYTMVRAENNPQAYVAKEQSFSIIEVEGQDDRDLWPSDLWPPLVVSMNNNYLGSIGGYTSKRPATPMIYVGNGVYLPVCPYELSYYGGIDGGRVKAAARALAKLLEVEMAEGVLWTDEMKWPGSEGAEVIEMYTRDLIQVMLLRYGGFDIPPKMIYDDASNQERAERVLAFTNSQKKADAENRVPVHLDDELLEGYYDELGKDVTREFLDFLEENDIPLYEDLIEWDVWRGFPIARKDVPDFDPSLRPGILHIYGLADSLEEARELVG